VVSEYFNGQAAEEDLKELNFDKGLLHPTAAGLAEANSSRRSSGNSAEGGGGKGRRGRRSSSVHNLYLFSSAAMARKRSEESDAGASSRKSSNEHPVTSALSSKRNSCTCRKCSIFNLDDCEPKEVSSVIKYLRFRKVSKPSVSVLSVVITNEMPYWLPITKPL
jgi:hypothetical protein